jgi:Spy/CpxP family protein refolding chaperone
MRKFRDSALKSNQIRARKMKYRILHLAMAGFLIACAVNLALEPAAQDLGSLAKQAGGIGDVSTFVQKLHLSPEQVQQVWPILQKEMPKLQAIKGSSSLSDQQKVAQGKAVQQKSDSKLKTILSSQQFLSLKSFRSQQLQELVHGAMPH